MEALSLFDVEAEPRAPTDRPRRADIDRRARARRSRPAPRRPTLLAVDGNSLAHRAFHAYGDADLAGSGRGRGALHGFFALLAAVCDRTSPDALVVGFDCRERSLRRDRYPAYKANRREKDPALYALLDLAAAVLADCAVPTLAPAGWEADDVVASAAATAAGTGWRCVVATSDRDAFALVDATTTVLRLRSGMDRAEVVDAAWIRRTLRIEPAQYADFAALRGDASDNLPGVPGIGPARAAALLRAYPTVPEAAADPLGCRSVLGAPVGQALIDDLAAADSVYRRNVALMSPHREVTVDLEACRRTVAPAQVEGACRSWGLPRLAGRLAAGVAARPDPPPPPGEPPDG